jgi:DNA-binding transcriptional ArsR family regulator
MYNTPDCIVKSMDVEQPVQRKTLQIAIFSDGQTYKGIRDGIRLLPMDKLVIIHEEVHEKFSKPMDLPFRDFVKQIANALMTQVEEVSVKSGDLNEVLEAVKSVYRDNCEEYDDFIMNVTEGGKLMSCTAISSAFIFGIRAFWIDLKGVHMLPILKLGYQKILSETKLSILKALVRNKGRVDSLEQISEITGLEKSLISRHMNGTDDSHGLVDLGLVSVNRGPRGRTEVEITALGKIVTF